MPSSVTRFAQGVCLVVLVLMWGDTASAYAQSRSLISLTISRGPGLVASVPVADTFAASAGASQQTIYSGLSTYGVTDSTGTGNGWDLTFQLGGLTCRYQDRQCPLGETLLSDSLTMRPPRVVCDPGTDCTGRAAPPTVFRGSPIVLQPGSPVRVASADTGHGMGAYLFEPASFGGSGHDLALHIPFPVTANTYTPSFFVSLVQGP